MPIEIEELAPGYFKFNSVADDERALIITLTLWGPDNIKTEKRITWNPAAGSRIRVRQEALPDIASKIRAVQSWRAEARGNELSIGVADPEHYRGTVTLELV